MAYQTFIRNEQMKKKIFDIAPYLEEFGYQELSVSRIDHEDAIVAVVYKITEPDGRDFILKISEREPDYIREIFFLRLLKVKLPIPRIVKDVPPQKGRHGAILMECLPGALLNPNEMTQALACELGSSLARLHLNRFPGYGDPIKDLSENPTEYLSFKFNEGLSECSDHLPPRLVEACKDHYHNHLHLLKAVDGPLAVHRDFRPGNIIVHKGKLQGIIDWAGARASFAEEDFCSLEHVDWLGQHREAFLSAYGTIRPVPNYQPLIPFLRLNKAIATIGFTIKSGTFETRDQRLYRLNRQYLETLLRNDE